MLNCGNTGGAGQDGGAAVTGAVEAESAVDDCLACISAALKTRGSTAIASARSFLSFTSFSASARTLAATAPGFGDLIRPSRASGDDVTVSE